eukprot:CAMPEP_0176491438 /NCGR_PEP_ID=MMETSP0200_2-20121128/8430_1 /TAXON_ID=947934 /ORGANISM="Chaetoceros sp., Strain GSL56" /LENGTH=267 /DNA_ID=CAMNT_0017888863 /DNA_START=212 /DNA_END=1012 /DNA_ORIENTATION=-
MKRNSNDEEESLKYSSAVDTSNITFQRKKESKPDKEHLWKGPMEEDGWVHAHNALRGELQDIKEALQSFPRNYPNGAPLWTIEFITSVWKEHEKHVISHHTNEDEIMTPFMKERIILPEKLEEDHRYIVECMKQVSTCIESLKEGDSIDGVVNALLAYEAILIPHLLEEERVALPLCRAYFTPKEVRSKVFKMSMSSPPVEMGSFIHYMTEESFRTKFMKQEGMPWFVWWLVMRPKYRYFLKHVKEPLDSLRNGQETDKSQVEVGCW